MPDNQSPPLDPKVLAARITEYLSLGGLFNPEMANHDAVRDLLIDCRAALSSPEQGEMAPPIIYGKPHTHCDDCGTKMLWSSERKESWMCPLCVLRRMHAAEDQVRRSTASQGEAEQGEDAGSTQPKCCPCCGGAAILYTGGQASTWYRVMCKGVFVTRDGYVGGGTTEGQCVSLCRGYDTAEEALAVWNRRAALPAPAVRREDVEGAIDWLVNQSGCPSDADTEAKAAIVRSALLTAPAGRDDARDAKLWRWFRDRAWVGTNEDGEIDLAIGIGEPEELACLTAAERETFTNDSPDRADMPSLCQRIAEEIADVPAALLAPRQREEGTDA